MKKRHQRKLLDVLKHFNHALMGIARHTETHCKMISNLEERVTKQDARITLLEESMESMRRKGLN